ncbi:hypothetical protein C0431_08060 [bacterium]|nr:hypothetical protein [bacterium]
MPGYITTVRVRFDNFSFEWRSGSTYRWQHRNDNDDWGWSWNDRDDRSYLDETVDDIYDAFRRGQVRYLDRLIPTRGSVWIELNRYSSYHVDGDDFYDLMKDLIEGTRTRDYRIREVRRDRGRATVVAEHSFSDPWGRTRTSRHYYGLEEGRRGYEIVAFRVED